MANIDSESQKKIPIIFNESEISWSVSKRDKKKLFGGKWVRMNEEIKYHRVHRDKFWTPQNWGNRNALGFLKGVWWGLKWYFMDLHMWGFGDEGMFRMFFTVQWFSIGKVCNGILNSKNFGVFVFFKTNLVLLTSTVYLSALFLCFGC